MDLLPVLFPQVRAQVLRLLFADAAAELHLRELTRRSGLALGTVQTELAKLAAAQLVVSERDGNRLYYRANAAHPLFPVLRQLVRQTTASIAPHEPIAPSAPNATPPSAVRTPSSVLRLPSRNPELKTLNQPAQLAIDHRQPPTDPLLPSRNPEPETQDQPAPPATLTLNEFD